MLCRYARFGFGAAAAAGMLGGPVILFNPAGRVARAKTLRVWTTKMFVKQISEAESVELQQGIDVERTG